MTQKSRSTRGGWRVALRLARREALRRKGQTALMLLLICLPVIAVTAASIVWRTQDVTSAESVDRRMGSADALLETSSLATVYQTADPERGGYGGDGAEGDGDVLGADDLDAVLAVLGRDRGAIPIGRESLGFETDKGIGDFEAMTTDLANPLTDGLLESVQGKYPPGPGEVVVNQSMADRGPGIGDTLTVIRKTADGEQDFELKVVGIAESTAFRGYPHAAALPKAFGTSEVDDIGRWLVGGGPVSWDEVTALNKIGVLATSRAVLDDPPAAAEKGNPYVTTSEGIDDVTLTVLALVVVMVLIEVVLLSGPAFAVRAKAQAHTLALVAATGGTPRQARRTVLASGVVVGAVGGVLGVVLGIVIGTLAVPIAQRFDSSRFGPFDVPWLLLLLVAGFGFLSAVLAALVPAFSASRQNVVAVLAGRRGEGRPSGRSPVLGVVLLGLGVTGAALGSAAGDAAPVLIAGSAVVSVLGMILLVPLAVTLVSRLAARLPLALRFAARDAARHRTRTVPAVAAVGATVAGVVALGIAVSSQEAANEAAYQPQLPDGYASVAIAGLDRKAIEGILRSSVPGVEFDPLVGIWSEEEGGSWSELTYESDGQLIQNSTWSSLGTRDLVGTEVPDVVPLTAADRLRANEVLAQGGAVLLRGNRDMDESGPDQASRVTITTTRYDADGMPDEKNSTKETVPAVMVTVTTGLAPAVSVLPPDLVKTLGLKSTETALLMHQPITGDQQKDVTEELAALPEQVYTFYVERGYQPDSAVQIIQFVLAALGGVLMLGGTLTATFLALSDARPDLATMAAVGARPRTRRGVAAAYALVVGGVGAVLGAPVGFIPGLAISRPLTENYATGASSLDIPWLLIISVVIGLPLLTAAAVGACARGRLPLTARVE